MTIRRRFHAVSAMTLCICAIALLCYAPPTVAQEATVAQRAVPQTGPTALAIQGQEGIFLKVDGIPGNSTDPAHSGWFEVQGWQFGIEEPRRPIRTQSAVAQTHRLVVLRSFDMATAHFYENCSRSVVMPEVKLEVVTATATYELTLSSALVVAIGRDDYAVGAPGLETISFEANQFTLTTGDGTDEYLAAWARQR